jgi:hypothetical protein
MAAFSAAQVDEKSYGERNEANAGGDSKAENELLHHK